MFSFASVKHSFITVRLSKFTNIYFKMVHVLKHNFIRARKLTHTREFLNNKKKQRIETVFQFCSFYKNKIFNLFSSVFLAVREIKTFGRGVNNFFLLKFVRNKITAVLQNFKFRNLTSVISGFFIKYFDNQKSKKKSKTVKLLIARYFRKVFIVSRLRFFNVILNRNPVDVPSFFTTLHSPIITPFYDPYKEEIIDETLQPKFNISVNYFLFKNSIPFHKRKLKKKGRIKRKILRKLVFENKIVD